MIKSIQAMPESVRDRFKVLHMLSDRRSTLNDEFNVELKNIKKQIVEKKRPFNIERRKMIDGELTELDDYVEKFELIHDDLSKKVASIITTDKDDDKKEPIDTSYLKNVDGIPDFWLRAIKSNKLLWDNIKK